MSHSVSFPPMSRLDFIPGWPIKGRLLEIGPGANPQFSGPLVEYFDIVTADEMRLRYRGRREPADLVPETIHYVSPTGDMSILPAAHFADVASSHNIEHHPDLVRHLQDVARILKPGGAYILLVPDHRYCFDRAYPASTLFDVLGAHAEQRVTHDLAKVIRQRAGYLHNDFLRHWRGDHGDMITTPMANVLASCAGSVADHFDVHAWQFTPETFSSIMTDLHALNLSPLCPEMVSGTPVDNQEFCAVLRKD